jgi:hypothetical protein
MRLFLFVLAIACLSVFGAVGQGRVDLLYLKSGETLRGKLESYEREESIVFVLTSGDTIRNEGATLDLIKGIRTGRRNNKGYNQKTSGFWNLYELGVNFDNEGGSAFYAQGAIQGVWGYQWSKMLKTGLGIGIEAMEDFNVVPVFASIQGDWRQGKVTPFHFVNIGFAIASPRSYASDNDRFNEVKGGFRFNSGLGVKIHQRKTFITVSAGYLLQNVDYKENFWGGWWSDGAGVSEVSRSFRRMSFKIGLGF